MECPHCNNLTSPLSKKCVHCGNVVKIECVSKRGKHIQCPFCDIQTDLIELAGIELDLCPKCSGLWFDRGELRQFEKAVINKYLCRQIASAMEAINLFPPRENRPMHPKCPVCNDPMLHKNFVQISGIVLDRCKKHGTWVDPNDIIKILDLINSGRLEKLIEKKEEMEKGALGNQIIVIDSKENAIEKEVDKDSFLSKIDLLFDFLDFF